MDPIQTIVEIAGESAKLKSPADTKGYDPTAAADYAPNDPGVLSVRGIDDKRADYLPDGATSAFTFACSVMPPGLQAQASILTWRGQDWKVVKWRERYHLGALNGVTLYLAR